MLIVIIGVKECVTNNYKIKRNTLRVIIGLKEYVTNNYKIKRIYSKDECWSAKKSNLF